MMPLRKFFNRKENDRHNIRVLINQTAGFALGEDYKTNKAILKDLSLSGARFELPNGNPIPQLFHFHDIPFKMQIPGTQDIIDAIIDIVRIYTRDENDNPVYGFAIEFQEISKEHRMKLEDYIRAKATTIN